VNVLFSSEPRVKITWHLWDHRDRLGRPRCRLCSGLLTGRQRSYCSDSCRIKFESAVVWSRVRKDIWERDNRRCQRCGDPVLLHSGNYAHIIDGKWISGHRLTDEQLLKGVRVTKAAEIHHIKPVTLLKRLAKEALMHFDTSDEILLNQAYEKMLTILYLDWNNLKTVCMECHLLEHREMVLGLYEGEYLRNWVPFWEYFEEKLEYEHETSKTLEWFFKTYGSE